MIKKLRVAVDHGNRNMKTCHFIFTTGLTEQDKKPARGEKYLKYQGKYYTLSEKRIPYQRDKTQDSRNRFWILTLFAIAMELEQKSQIQPEDVIQVELPIGLPPKHFAELCERYERYFKGDGKVQELCFNDKVYHLCIQNVMAFPQDYAAMMTRMMEIREIPKVVGIDIGGFTSDYLLMRSGRPDMDYCDSLEKGVITMYNDIISSINSEYDMLLEEADIDSIIKGKTQYYEEAVVQAVETMVQNFVTDLLNSIRERGIDTKSTYTVFIGGGAVLLERFLEQADRLGKHTFIRDMKANADGYDLLYRMTQAECDFMGKKNPFVFTIGFDKSDPDHVYVTELLNTTEKKAKLIVAAILAYTGRTDETGNGSISMEPDMLRPMMQQIIREEVRKVLEGQDVSKINENANPPDGRRTAADGSDYETECSGCYQCISQGIKKQERYTCLWQCTLLFFVSEWE